MISKIKTLLKFGFSGKQVLNRLKYLLSKKQDVLKYRPLWLLIYVSDLCNLRCKMCPHHTLGDSSDFVFLKKDNGMMKPETFRVILDKFPEATLVMFAGVGEPLVNPHFFELAQMAVEDKKIINLVTNGTLLDKDKIRRIVELKRFNQVSVSLNASNAEDYTTICNRPQSFFDKVVNNIKDLVDSKKKNPDKAKFEIIVSAVCSQQFILKVKDFLIFVDNLGVDRIDIHNYIDFCIIEKGGQWTAISKNIYNEKTLYELEKFCHNNIKTKVNLPIVLKQEKFCKKCEWFFKNLCFDAFGNIGGCGRVMNPDNDYGNILTSSDDVWNNKYMRNMRKKFLVPNCKLPDCCNHCIENYIDL